MGSKHSILKNIKNEDVDIVFYKNQFIPAKVTKVYDGDTCTVIFLLNKTPFKINIRVLGIDTPEIKGKNISDQEKKSAIKVGDYVRKLLLNKIVPIKIEKWDKYGGRINAHIYLKKYKKNKQYKENDTLSNRLINLKYAKIYNGGSKTIWTHKELLAINKSVQ